MKDGNESYILLLHHGTNDISSNSIVKDGFKLPEKKRDDHWLGNGVYFFREDMAQAMTWSRDRYKYCEKTKENHVLQTRIVTSENNFLNLDSKKGLQILLEFCRGFELLLEKEKISLDVSDPAKLRHFFMNRLPQEYHIIQRTFPTGSTYYDTDHFLKQMNLGLNGVQVCVRDVREITGEVTVVLKKRKRPKQNLYMG